MNKKDEALKMAMYELEIVGLKDGDTYNACKEALEQSSKDKMLKDMIKSQDLILGGNRPQTAEAIAYHFNQYIEAYNILKQIIENDNITFEKTPKDMWGYQYGM